MARDKKSELVKILSEHPKVMDLVAECVGCCMAFAVIRDMENEDAFDAFMVVVHNQLMKTAATEEMKENLDTARQIIAELDRLEKLVKDLHKESK